GTGLSTIGNYGNMLFDLLGAAGDPCFKTKLTMATSDWLANGCNNSSLSLTIRDPNNPANITADMKFTLNGVETNPNTNTTSNYDVYAKIVDTVPGNTD